MLTRLPSAKKCGRPTLSIVLPVYNEAERLLLCLDSLTELYDKQTDVEIIISEDGSTDDTLKIAEEYANRFTGIKVIHSEKRLGKGGGIIAGLREAKGDLVMFMDADLSVKPDQIPRLEKAINEGADLAFGSRSLPQSIVTQKRPLIRRVLAAGFNWLFRFLFGIQVKDTQCGFKMMKKQVSRELLDRIEIRGFAFDADLIVKAYDSGCVITEVPIVWSPVSGSKINLTKQPAEMGMDLIRVWWSRQKG